MGTVRHYSVEEANRTLPYVEAIVREVRERYRTIKERGQLHKDLTDAKKIAALKDEIRDEAERIHACMGELEAIGAELKDYDLGLVDFPAEYEGRSIQLCWKYGEEKILHWHEEEGGFDGRQPVPADQPAWPRSTASAAL